MANARSPAKAHWSTRQQAPAMNLSPAAVKTGFFVKVMCLAVPLIVGGCLAAPAAEAPARPNIVFVLVDDLR